MRYALSNKDTVIDEPVLTSADYCGEFFVGAAKKVDFNGGRETLLGFRQDAQGSRIPPVRSWRANHRDDPHGPPPRGNRRWIVYPLIQARRDLMHLHLVIGVN